MDKKKERNPSELAELDRQIEELQAKRTEVLNAKRAEALNEVREIIKRFGFTAKELGLRSASQAKSQKAPKPITYHNLETGETWDGNINQRGLKPKWIKAKIEDGSIDKYRVR